ncbi:endonuclease domain-containing protein [Pseudonocardia sp. GCM10023141]|uniref:endonuclease domain-containing protein n=1 Tax=Pseudonocardia sp. GCM10023141 TaxID=3252653 RepID=UPI00360F9F55
MDDVPGWPTAFRGSAAVAAGLSTRHRLRGPGYLRLYPDTFVRAAATPPNLRLRSVAAHRYLDGRGVLSGYSAAVLLRADCAPLDALPEITVSPRGQRSHPGLLLHRTDLAPGEITHVAGIPVTNHLRTAYDLARRGDLGQRVVAIDALANRGGFLPDVLLHYAAHGLRTRGNAGVAEALAHADRRAGSPMETRLRLIITRAGLPRPEVQWVVQNPAARSAIWLDLAYPEHRIAIEYEGGDHTTPEAVLRDAGRYTRLVDQGWRIYRYTKYDIYNEPARIVADLTRALGR